LNTTSGDADVIVESPSLVTRHEWFLLAFLDQYNNEVVRLWESWVDSGELVPARYEHSQRDAVIGSSQRGNPWL
jgi:hypothetical protein